MQPELANIQSEERLRSAVDQLANQLCQAVSGNFDFAVKLDIEDETAEKLQMLVNFVLDAARRALADAESESEAVGRTNEDLENEIARRRLVEEGLRQSELRERSIVDSAADGIVTINEQGIVESFNPAAEEIFGYAAEEIVGRNVAELMPSPHRQEHDGHIQAYVDGGPRKVIGQRREVIGRRKDGSNFPLALHVSVLFLGKQRLFTGMVRDVTERKQAEEELRGMAVALDAASAGFSRLDADGRYAMVNEAYARLVGYTPDEMIGMGWERTVHPHDLESTKLAYQRMLIVGRADVETRGVRKDGSTFHKHVAMIRRCDEDGTVAGHYCLLRDVTERKRAEEELRQARDELEDRVRERTGELEAANNSLELEVAERKHADELLRREQDLLRSIIEGTDDAVFAKDLEGRYLLANSTDAQGIGKSSDKLLGLTDSDLFTPEVAKRNRDTDRRVIATAQGTTYEQDFPTPDGSVRTWLITKYPRFNRDGGIIGVIGIAREISERKRAEVELKRAKGMAEAANNAKGEFLANMSHEIRTPLHGILSFARFGKDKALTADPEKLLDYFEKIDTSGQRLLVLLSDILDLAKMESGRLRYEFKPVDLRTVLRSVQNEFHSLLADRNINIDYAEPGAELELTLDENRMAQVVRNLLSNAAKFSPDWGTIRIEVNGNEDGVRISIRDHGIGIPEDELETVFDKFEQSSKTRTGAGGTGLGLSICREIVGAHQGRICCENHPQGGAVFHVVLPRTMQADPSTERTETRGVRKTEETTEQAPAIGIP